MIKKYLIIVLAAILTLCGGLVLWGSSFAKNMVHDQLVEQKIAFPQAEQLKAEGRSDLVVYAGQVVDTGTEAKAYSDYIKGHLQKVANGQTYSEVSTAYLKDKSNQTLAGQRQTLFMGETLRGLLLSAYGWGLMGTIAYWTGIGLLATALLAIATYLYVVLYPSKTAAKKRSSSKAKLK